MYRQTGGPEPSGDSTGQDERYSDELLPTRSQVFNAPTILKASHTPPQTTIWTDRTWVQFSLCVAIKTML